MYSPSTPHSPHNHSQSGSMHSLCGHPESPGGFPIPSTSRWSRGRSRTRSQTPYSRPSLTNKTSNKEVGPLVYGFVRELQPSLQRDIPDDIVPFIRAFVDGEHFCHSTELRVDNEWISRFGSKCRSPNDDMMTITNISEGTICALGNLILHSISRRVHHWKFQNQKYGKIAQFGITSQMEGDITSFDGAGCYGMEYPAGTAVEMVLDLKKRDLTFLYDGNAYFYHNELECGEGVHYRMAILMKSKGAKVTLLDYTVSK